MDTDDLAADLLLRDSIEITLVVDVDTAKDLPDDVLDRVLGKAARQLLRYQLEEVDGEF